MIELSLDGKLMPETRVIVTVISSDDRFTPSAFS